METGIVVNEKESSQISTVTPESGQQPPFYKERRFYLPALIIGTVLVLLIFMFAVIGSKNSSNEESLETPSPTPTEEVTPTEEPEPTEITPTKRVTVTPTPSKTPTQSPTVTPTHSPTPTPTRTPNPPQMVISYPDENQSITMNENQTFCVVDEPGNPPGDQTGLQRRHNLNDAGWAAYTTVFTYCTDLPEGLNRIQFQYKNSHNEESPTYTRQFHFHRTTDN